MAGNSTRTSGKPRAKNGTAPKPRTKKSRKLPLPTDRPVYERLVGESEKGYLAFRHYLATPAVARRLTKTAFETSTSLMTVRGWSSMNQWDARAVAFDDDEHRRWLAELVAMRRQQRQRMTNESLSLHAIAGAVLNELTKEQGKKARELKVSEALAALQLAGEIDRRLAEEPDVRIAVNDSWRDEVREAIAAGATEETEGALSVLGRLVADIRNARAQP